MNFESRGRTARGFFLLDAVVYTVGMIICTLAASMLFAQAAPEAGPKALFPGVRVDIDARVVEIDGKVPIRLDDPRAPRVYLELIACIPDTKEHEVLVVTAVKPSHVHAALLAIGLNPGKPATWRDEGNTVVPVAPEGDAVTLEFVYTDREGKAVVDSPSKWILNAKTNEPWPAGNWVFAGSLMKVRQGKEVYEADGAGTVIGLTSFGTEVLAWPVVVSPDSQIAPPEWIADAKHVPPMDTVVTIRMRAVAKTE